MAQRRCAPACCASWRRLASVEKLPAQQQTSAPDRENPICDLIHATRLPGDAVHTNKSRYPLAFRNVSDQPLSGCRRVHRKQDGVEALF
jgi:hypothetical protein